MEYLWLFFLYTDMHALIYFIAGNFMNKQMQSITTSSIALLIFFMITIKKATYKNPYLKIKGKLGKILAVVINIILIVILIKSFYR
jgi:hypothetical protein